jgi:hypothetical protein
MKQRRLMQTHAKNSFISICSFLLLLLLKKKFGYFQLLSSCYRINIKELQVRRHKNEYLIDGNVGNVIFNYMTISG